MKRRTLISNPLTRLFLAVWVLKLLPTTGMRRRPIETAKMRQNQQKIAIYYNKHLKINSSPACISK
jgi:hypothetical protein